MEWLGQRVSMFLRLLINVPQLTWRTVGLFCYDQQCLNGPIVISLILFLIASLIAPKGEVEFLGCIGPLLLHTGFSLVTVYRLLIAVASRCRARALGARAQ